ncbi:hypothetical protein QE250_17010, partial [Chromatiaceae bacterium AAb-1]|nr:hypothetical protein [Chromatiaceae bacterium AAb-1]
VNIDNDGIASITNTFQADLLINPCKEVNEFSQSIKIENPKYANVVLTYLEVGGKPVANTEGVFNKDDKDAGRFQLKVELPEGNRIRVCRTYQYQDDLKETPYLAITVGRYMKGARLSLKVGGSWEVKFIETGFQPNGPVGTPENRPQGWKTWYLAGQNELILPGKGYIFSFIPTMNKCDKS